MHREKSKAQAFPLRELLRCEKPGRYTDAEYGSVLADTKSEFSSHNLNVCVSFPDLYELGMSNHALRILYSRINGIEGVSCERVFAPAPDFEKLLVEKNVPLFSLESSTPLFRFDILAFSIGFELLATNLLTILQTGFIPLHCNKRGKQSPVIIAGGPGITNPMPFGPFVDAVLIGEGEGEIEKVMNACLKVKKGGGAREDIIKVFKNRKYWWHINKKEKTSIHTWKNFGTIPDILSHYPVPNIKAVQDHGVIEIMRGCINGCRFCHAGYFYRPCREKTISNILEEARYLVSFCGYREITLASLSSGDYTNIWKLLQILNEEFSELGVSFSLPSLKIDTFSLANLEELSLVRKSGLTFAVETPNSDMQKKINKIVDTNHIIQIMKTAKQYGWKQAKFYFMIGLPGHLQYSEEEDIISFLQKIYAETKMRLSVNIGTFVPKPHTPFQHELQLDPTTATQKIYTIRNALKGRQYKISYHSPFLSYIEGIIARGGEEVSDLLLSVHAKGARLDAWEDHFVPAIWREAIQELSLHNKNDGKRKYPWNAISFGTANSFLDTETDKSSKNILTPVCSENCKEQCGACNNELHIRKSTDTTTIDTSGLTIGDEEPLTEEPLKLIFSFSKKGKAMFLSHLNCMTIFERAFLRAGLKLLFSSGYNPKPKLEFAHPLMLGIESENEIAGFTCLCRSSLDTAFISRINDVLPQGFAILHAQKNSRKKSLMSHFKGAKYSIQSLQEDMRQINEKLLLYQKLHPGVIETMSTNGSQHSINQIEVTVRHFGKEGNLKTILSFLSGNEASSSFTDFLLDHSIIRKISYTVDGANVLIPFLNGENPS